MNTLADTGDALPGDGSAKDANNATSLRAALEEAAAMPFGRAIIGIDVIGEIVLKSDLDTIDNPNLSSIEIYGNGEAADYRVNGNSKVTNVFSIGNQIDYVEINGISIFGANQAGVYNTCQDVVIAGCRIYENGTTANTGGGIVNNNSGMIIDSCNIYNNKSLSGGGVYNASSSTVWIGSSIISDNTVDGSGGGIFNKNSTCDVFNTFIVGNKSKESGGGVFNYGVNAKYTMTGGEIRGNVIAGAPPGTFDQNGGGLCSEKDGAVGVQPSVELLGVQIIDNTAVNMGGLYFDDGTATVTDCTIKGNVAMTGPGICYFKGTLFADNNNDNPQGVVVVG